MSINEMSLEQADNILDTLHDTMEDDTKGPSSSFASDDQTRIALKARAFGRKSKKDSLHERVAQSQNSPLIRNADDADKLGSKILEDSDKKQEEEVSEYSKLDTLMPPLRIEEDDDEFQMDNDLNDMYTMDIHDNSIAEEAVEDQSVVTEPETNSPSNNTIDGGNPFDGYEFDKESLGNEHLSGLIADQEHDISGAFDDARSQVGLSNEAINKINAALDNHKIAIMEHINVTINTKFDALIKLIESKFQDINNSAIKTEMAITQLMPVISSVDAFKKKLCGVETNIEGLKIKVEQLPSKISMPIIAVEKSAPVKMAPLLPNTSGDKPYLFPCLDWSVFYEPLGKNFTQIRKELPVKIEKALNELINNLSAKYTIDLEAAMLFVLLLHPKSFPQITNLYPMQGLDASKMSESFKIFADFFKTQSKSKPATSAKSSESVKAPVTAINRKKKNFQF